MFSALFANCNIRKADKLALPATTLTQSCYYDLFINCYSLTTAPELPATTLAEQCYSGMFINCYSLTTAPELPATTLNKAPELPAITLAHYCYNNMFRGCSNLNYVKAAFTSFGDFAMLPTYNWLDGVSATGTFYKNAAATWNESGNNGIPSGWTVQTYTP